VLYVSFDESVLIATRITSLYSFTSVIAGTILGFMTIKARQLKPFLVSGTLLFTIAFGILIHYRGGASGSSHSGVIGGQVLLGLGKRINNEKIGCRQWLTDAQPVGCSHTLPKLVFKLFRSMNVSLLSG
jgi:hypothetical protein